MDTIKIIIKGTTPSKKNSKKMIFKGSSRPMLIPSKQFRAWHKPALESAKEQCQHKFSKVEIYIVFFAETRRRFDLTNKAESIMDLLVDAEILADDNYKVVPFLALGYGGLDQENPRAEITINEIS